MERAGDRRARQGRGRFSGQVQVGVGTAWKGPWGATPPPTLGPPRRRGRAAAALSAASVPGLSAWACSDPALRVRPPAGDGGGEKGWAPAPASAQEL